MTKNAFFSNDGKYRYWLSRIFDETLPLVAFVGMNPSTADADIDDPTIKKCISYCMQWGYGGFYMVNLFARKSTDPKKLLQEADPVGLDNDRHLKEILSKVEKTICCWGEAGRYQNRDRKVLEMIRTPYCLKINKNGDPAHPLYLKGDLQPIPYLVSIPQADQETLESDTAKNENHMRSYKKLPGNVLYYYDDNEIISYLQHHEGLSELYTEISASPQAAVLPIVVPSDEDDELDLHITVKHEKRKEGGQWEYYTAFDFAGKTNLKILLQTLQMGTGIPADQLFNQILEQVKDIKAEEPSFVINEKEWLIF